MASADFCRARAELPRSPRLSGKPYSRVRRQISPNKSVMYPRPSATSTCTPSSGSASCSHGHSPGATGLNVVSVRHLAGLTSCCFLTSYPSGMMTPKRSTGTKHRGLTCPKAGAPHNITPMLGVHARRVAESSFLKWRIARGDRVIRVVRRTL